MRKKNRILMYIFVSLLTLLIITNIFLVVKNIKMYNRLKEDLIILNMNVAE